MDSIESETKEIERRYCDRCMSKTDHEYIIKDEIIYTYKRKRVFKCKVCGKTSLKRGLRPSAESVY